MFSALSTCLRSQEDKSQPTELGPQCYSLTSYWLQQMPSASDDGVPFRKTFVPTSEYEPCLHATWKIIFFSYGQTKKLLFKSSIKPTGKVEKYMVGLSF